jgi:hypothetical protein
MFPMAYTGIPIYRFSKIIGKRVPGIPIQPMAFEGKMNKKG